MVYPDINGASQSGCGAARRFLCDEMLHRIGRWLRAAGHDTALAEPGSADIELLRRARREGRILLTRDRGLAARAGETALFLESQGVEENARELTARQDIDWVSFAFTRCLVDNAVLWPATERDRLSAPAAARELPGPLRVCPRCERLFWPGSHVRRMRSRLAAWHAATGT